MKKICYVVTIPLTIRAFFIPQLRYLAAHGFDVTVVCGDDGRIAGELGSSIHFHGIEMPRGVSVLGSLRAIARMTAFFKEQAFDLIQYSTPNAGLYASIAAKMAGCEVRSYHLMGNRFLGSKGLGRLFLKTMDRVACGLSTSIECVSRSNLELGAAEGVYPREKATVVWNGSSGGVDVKRFDRGRRESWRSALRRELGYGEADFIFGCVGRITGDKGINDLLEAFFQLQGDAKLFILGSDEKDGTVDAELWRKAVESPKVRIHAPVEDVERYYAMLDVLVFPSHREGFGNVVIEAAAMGTPAIVSDIPGPIDAILAEKTAICFPVRNVSELAAAMRRIRRKDIRQMGAAAADYVVQAFDSDLLCEKILERKRALLGIDPRPEARPDAPDEK